MRLKDNALGILTFFSLQKTSTTSVPYARHECKIEHYFIMHSVKRKVRRCFLIHQLLFRRLRKISFTAFSCRVPSATRCNRKVLGTAEHRIAHRTNCACLWVSGLPLIISFFVIVVRKWRRCAITFPRCFGHFRLQQRSIRTTERETTVEGRWNERWGLLLAGGR